MSRSLKIAIADDEPEVLEYFAMVLEEKGHQVVVTAGNGRELVERCRVQRPDLVITDIRMDELTGVEAIMQLNSDGPLPTILMSAHYRLEELDGNLDEQLIVFLPKPVKADRLIDAVLEAAKRLG